MLGFAAGRRGDGGADRARRREALLVIVLVVARPPVDARAAALEWAGFELTNGERPLVTKARSAA